MILFRNIPFQRINWTTSTFLIGTFILALTAVPAYVWFFGINWFLVALFVVMAFATGMSITLGYHRLFSHFAFQAKWPVRLFTLLFGAAAFENSVLQWASEHRRHHKHVDDHDDDPYAISRGFFYAHIGWLLFKLHNDGPYDNVSDLKKDKLVVWQDKYVQWIGFVVGFVMPTVLGALWYHSTGQNLWVGALGAFLFGGIARVVAVQHSTFFINSACHYVGSQPYSARCSARDSWFMALFTFGEGYHNYHHEFQYDYRNGVKPWQWDPTKWAIWLLNKTGLTTNLRRVASEKILLAELGETQRQLEAKLQIDTDKLPETTRTLLQASQDYLHELNERLAARRRDYVKATEQTLESSRDALNELHEELKMALAHLKLVNTLEITSAQS
jgi:stearoyl-CoA desaturase (delta-9 desaturase)